MIDIVYQLADFIGHAKKYIVLLNQTTFRATTKLHHKQYYHIM